jgi:hypothetical protein
VALQAAFALHRDFAHVTAPTLAHVASDPCLEHVRKLPASELETFIDGVLEHFICWSEGETLQRDACRALIRKLCFAGSVPLFEAACLLYALRDHALTDGEGAVFFDLLIFELLQRHELLRRH